MNRRSFFGRVFGGVAAVVVAPFLPKPKPTLALHPDAFKIVSEGLPIFSPELREKMIAASRNMFNPSPKYHAWMKKAMSEPIEIDPAKNVAFEWVDPA